MTSTAACEHCLHTSESVVHVLRDCTFATEVWRSIGEFDTSTDLWDGNCIEWLCHGLKSEKSLLFAIVCWMLWRARNEKFFSNSAVPALGIAHRSFSWVKMVREAATRTRRHIIIAPARQTVDVTWEPGPADWITVNSDGSFDARSGRATAGGLARYPDGRCIFAFTANLGNCSITRAEMRGAVEGLTRAWNAGFRRVLLQLDSQVSISLLTDTENLRHQHALETGRFIELQNRDWELKVKHTYREGNRAADYLVGIGYDYPYGSHTISTFDCNLGYFLRSDYFGIAEQRSILIND
ncbi:Putative ribonuclease H protein At1g65750 [Linum perenne]